jgi:uncharacterized low-complexity protein
LVFFLHGHDCQGPITSSLLIRTDRSYCITYSLLIRTVGHLVYLRHALSLPIVVNSTMAKKTSPRSKRAATRAATKSSSRKPKRKRCASVKLASTAATKVVDKVDKVDKRKVDEVDSDDEFWNHGEGFVWAEEEMCAECLEVLESGGGVHMGLAPPNPHIRTEPLGGPLEIGQEVTFAVCGERVTGLLVRKQTFYQVTVGADTYHTISVEQNDIDKATAQQATEQNCGSEECEVEKAALEDARLTLVHTREIFEETIGDLLLQFTTAEKAFRMAKQQGEAASHGNNSRRAQGGSQLY